MSAMTTLPFSPDGWTVDDLDLLPDDPFHYELVDGALLVTPPPGPRHGRVAMRLAVRLVALVDNDEWDVLADIGTYFDRRNYRQPDVLVCRREAVEAGRVHAPDVLLAVEVMSPSSVSTDRVAKPAQYAAAGIPHFWRIELAPAVLVQHRLDGDVYGEVGRFDDEVVLDDPFALRFRLTDLTG